MEQYWNLYESTCEESIISNINNNDARTSSYVVRQALNIFEKTPIPSPSNELFGADDVTPAIPLDSSLISSGVSTPTSRFVTPQHSDASSFGSSACSSVASTPTTSRKRHIRRDDWKHIKRKRNKKARRTHETKGFSKKNEGK